MKALIETIIIACLLSLSTKAQSSASTKLHFLNVVVGSLDTPELKTSYKTKKPILLKPRTWVTIQTARDSLELVIAGKPYLIHFDANKEHYFVFQATYNSRPVITEKSAQEFMLTAAFDSAKGPEIFVLSSATN